MIASVITLVFGISNIHTKVELEISELYSVFSYYLYKSVLKIYGMDHNFIKIDILNDILYQNFLVSGYENSFSHKLFPETP